MPVGACLRARATLLPAVLYIATCMLCLCVCSSTFLVRVGVARLYDSIASTLAQVALVPCRSIGYAVLTQRLQLRSGIACLRLHTLFRLFPAMHFIPVVAI